MITWLERWFLARSAPQAWLQSFIALLLIGAADWLTGPAIGFAIFYVVPVFGTTWRFGRRQGFVMAFASALVWGLVDLFNGTSGSYWVPFWNFDVGFALLATFAAFVARIKDEITLQTALANDLKAALAEVQRLSGLLRMCAWCRRIRNDRGEWEPFEVYVMAHSDVDITHGICPDCAAKQLAERQKPAGSVQ